VPSDNGLPGSYNYVRNSVKIIVNAYTGTVKLYAAPPPVYYVDGRLQREPVDPILKAWESVYPNLILPYAQMGSELQALMRYPQDMFAVQAAVYGRYHLTNPKDFYNNGSAWSLSPTDGAGSPNQTIKVSVKYDKQGYPVSKVAARMDPLYQVYALPGSSTPEFTISDAYVTAAPNGSGQVSSSSDTVYNLSAFMVGLSDPSDYGQLDVYRSPPGTILGPVQADAKMNSDPGASSRISLLNREGSSVLLGNVLMVPLNGSMLYVRPFYVTSSSTPSPYLDDFIVVYQGRTGFGPTLSSAIDQVLNGTTPPPPPTKGGQTVGELLAAAQSAYEQGLAVLKSEGAAGLGQYQADMARAAAYVNEAAALANGRSSATHGRSKT